jgi:hypothetical protein
MVRSVSPDSLVPGLTGSEKPRRPALVLVVFVGDENLAPSQGKVLGLVASVIQVISNGDRDEFRKTS